MRGGYISRALQWLKHEETYWVGVIGQVGTGIVASSFAAGLLSFFSPCVLPLLPVYIGILSTDASSQKLGLLRRCVNSLAFVLGISFVFVSLGAGAGILGGVISNAYVTIGLGLLIVVFGLHLSGIVVIPFLSSTTKLDSSTIRAKGAIGSFLLGFAFSFGWTPCVGPILGTILALAAEQGSVLAGMGLLFVYSLGLCIPFLVLSLASGLIIERVRSIQRYLPTIQRIGGMLIAVMGLWMVFTQVHSLVQSGNADIQDPPSVQAPASQSESQKGSSGQASDQLIASVNGASAGDKELNNISTAWKNVVLTDLDGEKHRLSELKGKPLYFEFWGSWCDDCVQDLDQLTDAYRRHKDLGDVQIVSVVVPDQFGERSVDDFVAWARENGVQVPVYMDTNASLTHYLNVVAFPTSVFVGSDGNLLKIRAGAIEPDVLEQLLAVLE